MGDVLTFTPRPKPTAPAILEPLSGPALRASLEEVAQTALDAADRIIAVLDRMDYAHRHEYANVHRGLHFLSNAATEEDEDAPTS